MENIGGYDEILTIKKLTFLSGYEEWQVYVFFRRFVPSLL